MFARIAFAGLTLFAVLISGGTAVHGQRQLSPAEQKAREQQLRQQQVNGSGIFVEAPKIYDDAMLLQMLRAAEARLATIQTIDQSGITSRIGAVSGATQRISSFGLNLQTPQIPGVTSVAKSGGTVTTTTDTDNVDAAGKPSTVDSVVTGVTGASTDVTTTAPAFGPPTATAPAPTTTMPSTFSVSASDALNEMMQLTYEIANLRLLLEGAISDQFMTKTNASGAEQTYVKPRLTLGFPITLASDRYEDAVAVVEVEVAHRNNVVRDQLPTVTALLPREKTYNVAAITDSSMSIGAGVATSVVGVSGSFMTGRKTYYITQDQDTVAMMFQPTTTGTTGFRWQFRPVLGKRHVRSGLKQTFVQLAFPAELTERELGSLTVRTYWLKYDRKTGKAEKPVKGSYSEYNSWPINRSYVSNTLLGFSDQNLQDLGGGQLFVDVPGRFLAGTYFRLGSTILRDGETLRVEPFSAKFTAPIADLALRGISIVGRDGASERLLIADDNAHTPVSAKAQMTGLSDGTATVVVTLDRDVSGLRPAPIVVVGDRVFGYSDAPVTRSGATLTAKVPMSLLQSNPQVTVTSLFRKYRLPSPVEGMNVFGGVERVVLLEQGSAASRFLLYGSRLAQLTVVEPAGASVVAVGRPEDAETMKLLTIPAAALKSHKQLLLRRGAERPFLLAMPPGEKAPAAKARERLVVNADEATFDLDSAIDAAPTVEWRKKPLKAERLDARTVRVSGLRAAGITAVAATETLEFAFAAGKGSATIEVVTQKVESIPRPPGNQ